MVHAVATSDAYRCPPAAVRQWPARDLVHALLIMEEMADRLKGDDAKAAATKSGQFPKGGPPLRMR